LKTDRHESKTPNFANYCLSLTWNRTQREINTSSEKQRQTEENKAIVRRLLGQNQSTGNEDFFRIPVMDRPIQIVMIVILRLKQGKDTGNWGQPDFAGLTRPITK
jgi:hypothetical protein